MEIYRVQHILTATHTPAKLLFSRELCSLLITGTLARGRNLTRPGRLDVHMPRASARNRGVNEACMIGVSQCPRQRLARPETWDCSGGFLWNYVIVRHDTTQAPGPKFRALEMVCLVKASNRMETSLLTTS